MDNKELLDGILKDFKIQNDIPHNFEKEAIIKLYIDKSIQSILNLTNRYNLPIQLRYVILDMATDYYQNNLLNKNTNSSSGGNIVKVTEEGRTVEFGQLNESAINSLLSMDISNKLELRKKEIYRYRLLYKGKENE